jgi:hypothetical protein
VRRLALVLLVLVAGCGGSAKPSDKDQITTALKSYYKSFGSGDSGGACQELAKDTRANLEKAGGGKDCTEILDAALKRPDYAKIASQLDGARVENITIAMDKATAQVIVPGVNAKATVPLKKENGAWKIASVVGDG